MTTNSSTDTGSSSGPAGDPCDAVCPFQILADGCYLEGRSCLPGVAPNCGTVVCGCAAQTCISHPNSPPPPGCVDPSTACDGADLGCGGMACTVTNTDGTSCFGYCMRPPDGCTYASMACTGLITSMYPLDCGPVTCGTGVTERWVNTTPNGQGGMKCPNGSDEYVSCTRHTPPDPHEESPCCWVNDN